MVFTEFMLAWLESNHAASLLNFTLFLALPMIEVLIEYSFLRKDFKKPLST